MSDAKVNKGTETKWKMFKPFSCFSERRSLDSKCREAQQSYLSVHASKPPDPRLKAAVSVRIHWLLNCESDFQWRKSRGGMGGIYPPQ